MDEALRIGVIGGSGLGKLLGDVPGAHRHMALTPFGPPSDAIVETEWAGVPVFLLARHGPGHSLSPSQVNYRANLFALKQLGVTHVIASTAVGSLREEFKPRDLAIPNQIIDKTFRRHSCFFDRAAVHVEFAEPFCPVLRELLLDAKPDDQPVHDRGCYVAMEGPAFSTRAESLMHRLWGGDLIGMTGMPEAKLAREAELSYAMVSLITDYDCWRGKPKPSVDAPDPGPESTPQSLLAEIIGNLEAASGAAMALIRRAIELAGSRREALLAAPSRRALELAIWSDKRTIDPDEIERLRPLWGRYFEPTGVT